MPQTQCHTLLNIASFVIVTGFGFEFREALAAERRPDTVAVGKTKQLFADDQVLERMTNISRELGVVTKANGGQPVSYWRIATATTLEGPTRF